MGTLSDYMAKYQSYQTNYTNHEEWLRKELFRHTAFPTAIGQQITSQAIAGYAIPKVAVKQKEEEPINLLLLEEVV